MAVVINGDTGITQAGEFNSDSTMGFKNRIINGGMVIAQRGTAAVTGSGEFPVDRFLVGNTTDGAFSAQQDSSAPAGFINSVKITTTTADATLTTTQAIVFIQRIEGTNVADLGFGTASAKTVTVSFWVRSSLTGTFGGSLRNSAGDRSYPFSYSISVADTWEQKSVTIAGDTSGTWLTTNDVGIIISFGLGAGPDRSGTAGAWNSNNNASATGAVSVIGTLSATWYVTGVQLEVGSVATSFDFRSIGTEIDLCRRYLQVFRGGSGAAASSTSFESFFQFNPPLRSTPALALTAAAQIEDHAVTVYTQSSAVVNLGSSTALATKFSLINFTGLTNSRYYSFAGAISGAGALLVSSEL